MYHCRQPAAYNITLLIWSLKSLICNQSQAIEIWKGIPGHRNKLVVHWADFQWSKQPEPITVHIDNKVFVATMPPSPKLMVMQYTIDSDNDHVYYISNFQQTYQMHAKPNTTLTPSIKLHYFTLYQNVYTSCLNWFRRINPPPLPLEKGTNLACSFCTT